MSQQNKLENIKNFYDELDQSKANPKNCSCFGMLLLLTVIVIVLFVIFFVFYLNKN